MNNLYYESHVTIDPVFDDLKYRVALTATKYSFKVAKLMLRRDATHSEEYIDDAFMSARGNDYQELEARTTCLILDLKVYGVVVRRYKIESTLLDSRIDDSLLLLKEAPPRTVLSVPEAYATHKIRYSDSSFYDEVCTMCGGTDASGDERLKRPCTGEKSK